MGCQVFATRMTCRETFFQLIQRRLIQHKNRILQSLMCQNTNHRMWWMKNKHQLRIGERCQSELSARNSVVHNEAGFFKNYLTNQQRLQISDLHFGEFPTPPTYIVFEDKNHDWSMYLVTISNGSVAVDQGSGVGWFSGRFEIFLIYSWYFNAKIWNTRCDDCFSTEQNQP